MNDDWRMVSFGDGFYVINHPDNPDQYLSESQGGNIVWTDFASREQQLDQSVGTREWWWSSGGTEVSFQLELAHRFSPHDKTTVYLSGQRRLQDADFGKTWNRSAGSDHERSGKAERRWWSDCD